MTIKERIRQRRLQMLVHSYLYYEMDENIIDDDTWSKWAKELATLQAEYQDIAKEVEYHELFSDWDGSTGAHLVYDDATIAKAKCLWRLHNEKANKVVQRKTGEESSEADRRKTDGKQRSGSVQKRRLF